MPLFTIYSILGGISLGLSTTEILGSVRSKNGKQQWSDEYLPNYIHLTKLTCQYQQKCWFQPVGERSYPRCTTYTRYVTYRPRNTIPCDRLIV